MTDLPRRRRLHPRGRAAEQGRPEGVRLRILAGGCSGLEYKLDLLEPGETAGAGDREVRVERRDDADGPEERHPRHRLGDRLRARPAAARASGSTTRTPPPPAPAATASGREPELAASRPRPAPAPGTARSAAFASPGRSSIGMWPASGMTASGPAAACGPPIGAADGTRASRAPHITIVGTARLGADPRSRRPGASISPAARRSRAGDRLAMPPSTGQRRRGRQARAACGPRGARWRHIRAAPSGREVRSAPGGPRSPAARAAMRRHTSAPSECPTRLVGPTSSRSSSRPSTAAPPRARNGRRPAPARTRAGRGRSPGGGGRGRERRRATSRPSSRARGPASPGGPRRSRGSSPGARAPAGTGPRRRGRRWTAGASTRVAVAAIERVLAGRRRAPGS